MLCYNGTRDKCEKLRACFALRNDEKAADMIIRKSKAEIEAMKEAGRISAKVLREVGSKVAPGVSTLELD